MKTPRELILERHQSAEAKLEGIRAEDLARHSQAASAPKNCRNEQRIGLAYVALKLWKESIRPWRHVWIGMALVWLVLLSLSQSGTEGLKTSAQARPRPNPELRAALRAQKAWRLQLLEPSTTSFVLEPQNPGPRTERRQPSNLG